MKNNCENCAYNGEWDMCERTDCDGEIGFCEANYLKPSSDHILMYGDIIVSKNFVEENCITTDNTKIKIIEWDGILYYYESVNDNVTEFKKIGRI